MPKTKLKYTLKIILGDYYGDGHREWDIVYFRSSHGVNEFNYAYREGVKKTKVDPAEYWCHEFQDRSIPFSELDKLIKRGFQFSEDLFEVDIQDSSKYKVEPNGLVEAILFVAQQGKPDLQTKILPQKTLTNTVLDKSGIGYGLF